MIKIPRPVKIIICIASICVVSAVCYYFAVTPELKENMDNQNNKNTNTNGGVEKHIDIVYYINLDKRTDRKTELVGELVKINYPEDKIERISAIYEKGRGHLGCSKSHIKTMQHFLASPHQTCFVLEDDFEWAQSPENTIGQINTLFENNVDFDVCMLSVNPYDLTDTKEYPFLQKVNNGLTASGYIVNKKFASTLLENFMEGAQKLEQSYIENDNKDYHGGYAIDQYWCNLQPQNKWYVFNPVLGKQRASFSDIQNGNVNYNV